MVRRWPVWLACAFAALEFVLFAMNVRSAVVPDIVVSLPMLGLVALAVAVYWQAWHAATEPAARRFWRMIALGATFVIAGQLLDLRYLVDGPTPPVGVHQLATAALPLLLVVVALCRLPVGGSRGERQRLLLDLLTVALAVALFVWFFATASSAGTGSVPSAAVSGAFMVIISLIVFGLLKALASGSQAVDRGALRLFTAGLVIEIVGIFVAPLFATRANYTVEVLTRCLSQAVLVAGASLARRPGATQPGPASRRPFSVMPYVAVASVDALLLATLGGHHSHRAVVAATAVVVTGLVVVRQIGAFRSNARLLDELGRQERRFRSLVQNASDVIAICDRDGLITYISPGVYQLIGLTPDDLVGTVGVGLHPDDQAIAAESFAAVLADPDRTVRYEFRAQHADGTWRRVRITMTNLLDDPAVGGIVTNSSDITETHEYHSQLSHQANHDSLTDLANRSLFGEQLDRALAGRDGRTVSLALIDLDDFKTVNDTLGHHAGDALLIAVAERLRRGVRPQDLVARLGGDEFAVLLDGAGGANVEAIADRMLGILTEPLTIDGHDLCVQASVGIAEAGPEETADRLMRHADLALYEAKGAGKGRYVQYAEHMRAKLSLRAESAAELHRALAVGEFELHYQPIVTLPAGRLTGVEALLRWRHPERGLVSPAEFIPIAEKTGMIVPIGRWVVTQACRDMAEWLREFPGTAPKTINVNVAPQQLTDPTFVDDVVLALTAAGLPANLLVLELVEGAIAGDAAGAVAVQLRRLRDLGVRIALDDFGTGQATLSLLDLCPVDELKLDRSFVRDPAHDTVATVVATMARVLGVDVVAEGIETVEQAEHLHRLGYGLAQGFHFARPVPASAIAESLRSERAADSLVAA